jgi:galactokinase
MNLHELNRSLIEDFRKHYGTEPRLFWAPGRVNLIGEHTDYNEGYVLPMAIDRGTAVGASARQDRVVRVFSSSMNESLEFDLDKPGPRQRGIWLDYVEGVAQALEARGVELTGADLAIASDISIGGGLSSSAALEVSVGKALIGVSGRHVDPITLALSGQQAEHEYVGTKCGIMDQFTATMGKAGHALLIDCRKLEAKPVALLLRDGLVVICDSKVRHSLAASEYNARRADCEHGVVLLREFLPGIGALRDVVAGDFERWQSRLPEPVRRRCRHVVTENERTLAATEALASGDIEGMGRLMAASHKSLRDDYEVSCRELDVLVESASSVPGVYGARMTGGGFGGCTVNIIRRSALESFCQTVSLDYERSTGIAPSIFPVTASDGACEVGGASVQYP